MYNYPGAPGYTGPPGYPGAAASTGPPGYSGGGPPGMAAPGTARPGSAAPPGVAPPGVGYGQGAPALGGPRNLPPNWQPPANMPNFNLNAPVIRLGTTEGRRGGGLDSLAGGRRDNAPAPARRGLGMDRDGDRRDGPQQVIPPTREEIARTIFVGNIPAGVGGDEGMERILLTAGKLVRWARAVDADGKAQTFGFAEYGDAQSLETAAEIFKEVHVPTTRQKPGQETKEGDEEVEKTQLLVIVDQASIKYAEEWSKTRNEDDDVVQFRLDEAKNALSQVLASLFNPPVVSTMDYGGDAAMHDAPADTVDDVEVAFVNLATAEDELAEIPEEMREMVAAEIAAFRDRSIQRDRERLRKEEEMEAEERRRSGRRASPPISAPTGPGGVNGVPLGPRAERGVHGAPSGPKGSQFPRDYQGGVTFVNGGAVNGGVYINREDDDDPASDSEIESRRVKKRDEQLEGDYKTQLAHKIKTEERTNNSLVRTSEVVQNEQANKEKGREEQAKHLSNFDDDVEADDRRLLYYRDRSEYMRLREKTREREQKDDAYDRAQEQRELAAQQKKEDLARGAADVFVDERAEELLRPHEQREPTMIKISLSAAAKKLEQNTAPRRTAADVEDLLDFEEVAAEAPVKKRVLVPIDFNAAVRANLTPEEIAEEQRQLARDIPTDKKGLWEWDVAWKHLPEKNIEKDIRDWSANKVLEILGLQEDLLVEAIVQHLKEKKGPAALVENLEVALDDEAEALVKKLWRMVIYYSETEKRGIK